MEQKRRRFSRVRLKFPARVAMDEGTSFMVEEFANLSIGGCLIPIEDEIPKGTIWQVTIPLVEDPEGPKIEVTGEVVRREEEFVGVKFTQISPESLFHLQNLMRYNAPDPDTIEEEIDEHPGIV